MKDYNAEVNAIMRFLAWAHNEKDAVLSTSPSSADDEAFQDEKLERVLNEYMQQWRAMHPWE